MNKLVWLLLLVSLSVSSADFGKQLAQNRPTSTTVASIYQPPARSRVEVTKIVVANTTGSAVTFRIFIHQTGSTYDESTAIAFDKTIPANDSLETTMSYWMTSSLGNIAVRTNTANALTFSIYGIEYF